VRFRCESASASPRAKQARRNFTASERDASPPSLGLGLGLGRVGRGAAVYFLADDDNPAFLSETLARNDAGRPSETQHAAMEQWNRVGSTETRTCFPFVVIYDGKVRADESSVSRGRRGSITRVAINRNNDPRFEFSRLPQAAFSHRQVLRSPLA